MSDIKLERDRRHCSDAIKSIEAFTDSNGETPLQNMFHVDTATIRRLLSKLVFNDVSEASNTLAMRLHRIETKFYEVLLNQTMDHFRRAINCGVYDGNDVDFVQRRIELAEKHNVSVGVFREEIRLLLQTIEGDKSS